jgi:hypothetical protein
MIKSNSNVIGIFTSVVCLFEIFNKDGFWFFKKKNKSKNHQFQLFQN